MNVETDARRVVRLSGTRNLRDVGGYATRDGRRTRWRTLYRSDCLDRLDEIGQTWLVEAGLRTIIDLRENGEVSERPNVFARSAHVMYRRIPFWDEPPPSDLKPDVREGYRSELAQERVGVALARVALALLEPGAAPVLIHCAAGKDRTGIAIGVLLEAVGVDRQDIAADYAMSSVCLGPEYVEETRAWALRSGLDWDAWAHLSDTPPERMIKTLEYVGARFGGVRRYLAEHGFPEERFAELRDLLTEAC